jgi:hypothetical protein
MVLIGADVVSVVPFSVFPGSGIDPHGAADWDGGAEQLITNGPPPSVSLSGWSTGGVPMTTVTVAGALVFGKPSVAVKVKVTVATPEPESVNVATQAVGVFEMATASRGRLGVPAVHDTTGYRGLPAVVDRVTVLVPSTPRFTVLGFATGSGSIRLA